MTLFNSCYRVSNQSVFLAANDGNWTQVSLSKREFIGSLIRIRYWEKAEWNELLQEPGPHKLEPECNANGPWPCFSPLLFFLDKFHSADRLSLCAGKYDYWLSAPGLYPLAGKGLPITTHPNPQTQIHLTTREDSWLVLIGHMFSSGPASES